MIIDLIPCTYVVAPLWLEVKSIFPNDLQLQEPRSGWMHTHETFFCHDIDLGKLQQKVDGRLKGTEHISSIVLRQLTKTLNICVS